jgi:hypothetical protein
MNDDRTRNSVARTLQGNLLLEPVFFLYIARIESEYKGSDPFFLLFSKRLSLSKKQFPEWLKLFSDKIRAVNLKLEHRYGSKDNKTKFVPWLLDKMMNSNDFFKTGFTQLFAK